MSAPLPHRNGGMKPPKRGIAHPQRLRRAGRSWILAAGGSAVATAAILALAIAVNVLIGRRIHWDIVTVLGIGGWVLFAVAIRRRR